MPSGTQSIRFGTIGLDNIATEFKRTLKDVRLGDYYLENIITQPIDTSVNMKIPFGPAKEGNPISVGDFYGAAWYQGSFSCYGVGESPSQYHTSNDAALYFRMDNCSSPAMRVSVAGSTYNFYGNGVSFTQDWYRIHIGDNEGATTYTFQYTDCRGTWYRNVTIGYGYGQVATQTIDLINEAPANRTIRL
jgi:hypothetical protein